MYENLLNPNEFSSISGVSKQTLLFYEKKNVILMKNYKKLYYSNYTGLTDNRLVSQRNSELYRKQKRRLDL